MEIQVDAPQNTLFPNISSQFPASVLPTLDHGSLADELLFFLSRPKDSYELTTIFRLTQTPKESHWQEL